MNPPMLTRPSFFDDIVMMSARENISLQISLMVASFVLRVAHLDEVCVLGEAGRVENDALVGKFVGDLAHAAEVVHRNGLSAGGVVCDRHDDERYLVGVLGKTFLNLSRSTLPLKGTSSWVSFASSTVRSTAKALRLSM